MADLEQFSESLTAYCNWLAGESDAAVRLWARRLKHADEEQQEAAIAEAVAWDYLACVTDRQCLVEVPGTGGPDFAFEKAGHEFAVEVTNVSTHAATQTTGLEPVPAEGGGFYSMMTERLVSKVRGKGNQLREAKMPRLVFVTTLHFQAGTLCMDRHAVEWVMCSTPAVTSSLNVLTGESSGPRQTTDLRQSIFLQERALLDSEGKSVVESRHRWLSAFLLGGFGAKAQGVIVFGGLHPDPLFPFDAAVLPHVPVASLAEWRDGHVRVKWSITEEQEREASRIQARRRLIESGHGEFLQRLDRELGSFKESHP